MKMTAQERDVLQAAREAVTVQQVGKITTGDLVKDEAAIKKLVYAVMCLECPVTHPDYWRER